MVFHAFPPVPLDVTMLNAKSSIVISIFAIVVTWRMVSCPPTSTHPADRSDFWDNLSWNFSNTPETDITHDYWDPLEKGTTDAALAMNNYMVRMYDSEIIPQLISEPPRNLCKVIYSYELGPIRINPGIFLQLHDVQNPPEVIWQCDPKTYYALALTDPDDITIGREEQLWLLGNIRDCNLTTADVLCDYRMHFVGDTIGVHRFNFFVYQQPNKTDFSNVKKYFEDDRCLITIREFSEQYKLGNPIYGNFFLMDF